MAGDRHDAAAARGVVAAHLPGYRITAVVPVGDGLDNVAFEVNGELIVRFRRDRDPARLDREACLLEAVAAIAPLAVPEPRFTVAELGCLAYLKLPGTPLLDLPRQGRPADAVAIAATLGELLTALHAVPADRMGDLADTDDQPLTEWRQEAAATYPTVATHIPAVHRGSVEAFLHAAPPDPGHPLVFSHNDLGIEHVLVDPGSWTVTGVIDWSDAALVDPARDFGLLHRDLGPTALHAALNSYRTDTHDLATLCDRAVFYARCGVLEDLAYGIETGRDSYLRKSLDAMEWLFPG
jgi:aminoglycoside phosphotransferase (APT) family kinase protein